MLYHWYELDLEATAPTDADARIRMRSRAPPIPFDRETAITQARCGGVGFSDASQVAAANNDDHPDPTTAKLRIAGLGIIGDPTHRVQPGHYSMSNQAARFANTFFMFIRLHAFGLHALMVRTNRKIATGCSHTIVANATDDYPAESDGAQRQRFGTSGRQSAN